ncbi:MAG: hypothetical protein JO345_25585 [Streptosporangiaceae bacterium]|nr:hypothetical protein [Streptosporangiaceae bacterium]
MTLRSPYVEAHLLASKAHHIVKGLVGGCALLLGVTLSGCAAPQFTYVANTGQSTYFKVPNAWHKISDSSLSSELRAVAGSSGGGWTVAYEAGGKPTAGDFLSFGTGQPFVFAEVGQLTSTASSELSYDTLRDFFLPVTSTARQNAAAQGFPLTDFKQIRDQVLTLSQGVHGVRETYDYTANGGVTDTFDVVALTNADQTVVYLLVVHCTSSCYSNDQTEINDVMSSFTIRSS